MSYDIRLKDPATGDTVRFPDRHAITGGTYCIGGSDEAWLNVTYNYVHHFRRVIDPDKGIRALYGTTAKDSLSVLARGIAALGVDVDDDYWKPTEGNARAALQNLFTLACMAPPDSVWDGD